MCLVAVPGAPSVRLAVGQLSLPPDITSTGWALLVYQAGGLSLRIAVELAARMNEAALKAANSLPDEISGLLLTEVTEEDPDK